MTEEELHNRLKDYSNPPCRVNLIQQVWEIMNSEMKELEKENAELKDYRLKTRLKEQTEMSKYALNLEHKLSWYDTKLTNAKEIIKELLRFVDSLGNYSGGIFDKAEQFLNSEVEK